MKTVKGMKKTEQNFDTFKEYIVTNAKDKSACASEYKKALQSTNFQELLKVIVDNGNWCYTNKLVNAEILKNYVPDSELLEANIYVEKQNVIQKEGLAHYYSSSSEHYGSSSSEHYDSSSSEHYGSSSSKHYGSSSSEHYGSSSSEHYGSSSSEHYDSSYASVYTLNNRELNDKVIIRERSTQNVYCKKDAFTIIQVG